MVIIELYNNILVIIVTITNNLCCVILDLSLLWRMLIENLVVYLTLMCCFLLYCIMYFLEKAIPEIVPIATLEPAQFRETIQLNCSVKYENDNLNADYNLKLTWKKKGGKPFMEKTAKYGTGEHTVTLQYSLVITSSDDGGTYVCGMELQRVINNAPQLTKSSAVDLQSMLLLIIWNDRFYSSS